jgi:predicted permease
MFQDLRYGFRVLLKHKWFTAVAVLTLALGIGATTAIFSVVSAVVLNPYPYAKPHEIWTPGVVAVNSNQTMRPYLLNAYQEMSGLPAFSSVMATLPANALLTGEYAPETLSAIRMSGNAFQFLGVPALVGRTILPSDIRANGEPEPVTVLSFNRWQRLFNGDPNAIGKTLRLNDETYTIIGVMPPRFGWWTSDGVWLAMGRIASGPGPQMVFPIVRLAPGVTARVAEQQLHALHLEFAKEPTARFPREEFTTRLTNYLDVTVASGEMRQSLQLLFGAVAFLLLIACANVANLQLAKASGRTREMSLRMALGAGRVRLVRQLLTESVIQALLGGALGLVFAYWITQLMVTLMPRNLVPNEARIEVNGRVLLFSLVVSVVTGILFGLAPALQSSRQNLVDSLKEEGRGSSASKSGRVRALLVVVEVALAVVLLFTASLTIRSFAALQKVDPGYQVENVLQTGIPLPPRKYATWEARNRFAHDLLERVKNTPGVVAATIGNGGMPFGGFEAAYTIEGQSDSAGRPPIRMYLVAPDYLKTLGIPLRQGRMISEQEVAVGDHVAVINEAAVKLWPAGENPVGRRVKLKELGTPPRPDLLTPPNPSGEVTIIGIMADTRNDDIRADTLPAVLVPYTLMAPPGRGLVIRTTIDPTQIIGALRAHVRDLDVEQPLNHRLRFRRSWVSGPLSRASRWRSSVFSLE